MSFRTGALLAAVVLTAPLLLGGCTTGMSAAVQSVRLLAGVGTAPETAKLDPQFEYLRVTRGKHVASCGAAAPSARLRVPSRSITAAPVR